MGIPNRKDIRLKNYDYSRNGAYFVTICTKKKCAFSGKITININRLRRKTAMKKR